MLEGACCEAFFNVGVRDSFGRLSVGWLFANIEAGRPTMTEHRLAHQAGKGEESLRKVFNRIFLFFACRLATHTRHCT